MSRHEPSKADIKPRTRPLTIYGLCVVLLFVRQAVLPLFPGMLSPYLEWTVSQTPAILMGAAGILVALAVWRAAALNSYNIRRYLRELSSMREAGKVAVGNLVVRYAKPAWYIISKLQDWNRKGFFVYGMFVPTPAPSDESRVQAEFQFDSVRFPRNAAEAISGLGLHERWRAPDLS